MKTRRIDKDNFTFRHCVLKFDRRQNVVFRRVFPISEIYRCVDRDYCHAMQMAVI